jgi:prefoldin beta subunit
LASQRQQYAQQQNENNMVKQELDLLDESAKVYKLVGPVLLKQDTTEAKSNVSKRLEFIQKELEKAEKKLQGKEEEAVKIRQNIASIQMQMQKNAAKSAGAAAVAAQTTR